MFQSRDTALMFRKKSLVHSRESLKRDIIDIAVIKTEEKYILNISKDLKVHADKVVGPDGILFGRR